MSLCVCMYTGTCLSVCAHIDKIREAVSADSAEIMVVSLVVVCELQTPQSADACWPASQTVCEPSQTIK